MDPLGEALSAGIGWIIEHLSPLKDWLNELAGDSDAVAAAASTWTNIGATLNSCAGDLDGGVLQSPGRPGVTGGGNLQDPSRPAQPPTCLTTSGLLLLAWTPRPLRARPRERMISPKALSTESNAS